MPHEPGHNSGGSRVRYLVYGTNEPYTGRVVMIAGIPYTTVGGALEGPSVQLYEAKQAVTRTSNQTSNQTSQDNNPNPVTRLFNAPRNPRYRRSDNNRLVRVGAKLHEHQDGTIMTQHSMGANDNSVVVNVVTPPNVATPTRRRTNTTTTRQTNTSQTRTRTSNGGNMSGRRTGGSNY